MSPRRACGFNTDNKEVNSITYSRARGKSILLSDITDTKTVNPATNNNDSMIESVNCNLCTFQIITRLTFFIDITFENYIIKIQQCES